MSRLRVLSLAVSLDGFCAGPNQDLQNPLGVNGPELMSWFFPTRAWRQHQHEDGGETGIDNEIAEQRIRPNRCLDHGTQHVRSRSRAVAG